MAPDRRALVLHVVLFDFISLYLDFQTLQSQHCKQLMQNKFEKQEVFLCLICFPQFFFNFKIELRLILLHFIIPGSVNGK